MGLDMYLIKKRKKDTLKYENTEDIMYWRKANAIHKWFIENCGDGEDNCDYKEVSRESIEELKDLCEEIIKNVIVKKGKVCVGKQYNPDTKEFEEMLKDGEYIENPEICEEILPTCNGFFFGSTNYDQYYLKDIEETKEKCEEILDSFDFENDDLYYLSSW